MKEIHTKEHTTQSPVERKYESWLVSKWRPVMAYVYTAICLFDFIVGPLMFTLYAGITQNALILWQPLTLQSGGMFHLAMGAVLGLSAWTRGMEKIERTRKGITTLDDPSIINDFNDTEDFGR